MTFTSSWDGKKATVKLPLFGLSFEFVRLDGSSRSVACGANSITMGLSMNQHCWLTTSERFLERRSGRRHSYALQIPRLGHKKRLASGRRDTQTAHCTKKLPPSHIRPRSWRQHRIGLNERFDRG
jgi:hypothetical protein